jgi:hypothetical protein
MNFFAQVMLLFFFIYFLLEHSEITRDKKISVHMWVCILLKILYRLYLDKFHDL